MMRATGTGISQPSAFADFLLVRGLAFRRVCVSMRGIAESGTKRMPHGRNGLTYADAGVDIDAGNELVKRIAPFVKATARTGANSDIGGFGGHKKTTGMLTVFKTTPTPEV